MLCNASFFLLNVFSSQFCVSLISWVWDKIEEGIVCDRFSNLWDEGVRSPLQAMQTGHYCLFWVLFSFLFVSIEYLWRMKDGEFMGIRENSGSHGEVGQIIPCRMASSQDASSFRSNRNIKWRFLDSPSVWLLFLLGQSIGSAQGQAGWEVAGVGMTFQEPSSPKHSMIPQLCWELGAGNQQEFAAALEGWKQPLTWRTSAPWSQVGHEGSAEKVPPGSQIFQIHLVVTAKCFA